MNKRKIQFKNIFLLLTLNGINVFGMNRETINETQKKMSTEDFLNEIYKNFIEIHKAFYNLYREYYMLCKLTSKNEYINDIFHILKIKEEQIKDKEQFKNKNPTEILMTNITLKKYIKEINKYNLNLFLEKKLFDIIIQATNYMFNYIINDDFFKEEWIEKRKDQLKDKCIQDYTIKVFENILKYLTTMESFIHNSLEKNNQLKLTLFEKIEDLKKNNQKELEEIKKIKTQEDLQKNSQKELEEEIKKIKTQLNQLFNNDKISLK